VDFYQQNEGSSAGRASGDATVLDQIQAYASQTWLNCHLRVLQKVLGLVDRAASWRNKLCRVVRARELQLRGGDNRRTGELRDQLSDIP
jgi:hypothetical protein